MKEISQYLLESKKIIESLDQKEILKSIKIINNVRRKKGRIFFAGSGGGAGHGSHATNDFRKLCNIEAYNISDNSSELTARVNDEGWETSYSKWLKISKINHKDLLFIFSVGGGNLKKKISINLINAVKYAKKNKSKIISIIGKKNSFCGKYSDSAIVVPLISKERITPHTEGFQAIIWHLIVSHTILKKNKTKW